MSNLLMLLIVAGSSSLCACAAQPQARSVDVKPPIVVHQPKRESGDFTVCKDGSVLVFPASHPLRCS
ncbi:hypothetical protein [Paraburkholderia sp. BL10I2N1]|uniref:hypothetical protein n=1 Tax=Paraburkholderia sp. BL10I2N1 TaxID=1938796 RepID=UPI00106082B1|nr:hypothetical protein [Paraburkholderia sp. BL10I2N1]TDN59006.1 hypothetical protein B0G77_8190 [Paraburkholderia sp. BL10I2N1]